MLGEFGRIVGCFECVLVFLEPCDEALAGLSHIRFTAVGACQLYTPDRECMLEVCCLCINNFCMVLLVWNVIFMSVFLNMFKTRVQRQHTV